MSRLPLVTIGLPVYNSERYIEQSLDSLLAQTYGDFVLIISDNASTDSSPEICRRYAKADPRVSYFRNERNIGSPRNFNRVFELTTTPYLKWSAADDFWAPTFLAQAVEIMERDRTIALCYPRAVLVDADGANPQDYDDVLHLMQDDPAERFVTLIDSIKLAHQLMGLVRMEHLRRTHLFGAHVGSDINLLAELTLYGKFFELPERLFFRRLHKDAGSWKRDDAAHQARFYLAAEEKVGSTIWARYAGFASAVRHCPLGWRAKWRLFRAVLRRFVWVRRELGIELAQRMSRAFESRSGQL